MRIIIDRFEGDTAIVELDDRMLSIPAELVDGAHEGDTVEITVIGKPQDDEADTKAIFARLRRRHKARRSSDGQT